MNYASLQIYLLKGAFVIFYLFFILFYLIQDSFHLVSTSELFRWKSIDRFDERVVSKSFYISSMKRRFKSYFHLHRFQGCLSKTFMGDVFVAKKLCSFMNHLIRFGLIYPDIEVVFFFLFPHFSYLVAAAGLQSLWSLVLAILDAYALLVGRRLQNPRIVSSFAVGDGVRYSWIILLAD